MQTRLFRIGLMCIASAASCAQDTTPAEQTVLPLEITAIFERLDKLGVPSVKEARYVSLELQISDGFGRDNEMNEKGWLLSEDERTVTVWLDELWPVTYNKHEPTTIPSSWKPIVVKSFDMEDADFEETLEELSEAASDDKGMPELFPKTATCVLAAYAAWQRGLSSYCMPVIEGDWVYRNEGVQAYPGEVWEEFGWRYFLHGVNLLKYADKREAIPYLKRSLELAPTADFGEDRHELITQLEKRVGEPTSGQKLPDVPPYGSDAMARVYVAELVNLRCLQSGQPGSIDPYWKEYSYEEDPSLPTTKLLKLGMDAIPALIDALEDDTPTRTVEHWRDFHRSRKVWRVSDFAVRVLSDISQKSFVYHRKLKPEEKQAVIAKIRAWYAESSGMSEDDRMLELFNSQNEEEWFRAGEYFLQKGDKRAVSPLLSNIPKASPRRKSTLCQLVAYFGDPSAKDVIHEVMRSAEEPSVRMGAAIALFRLQDYSGIPLAIEYVAAEERPREPGLGFDDRLPVWLLMSSKKPEAMETLKRALMEGSPERAGSLLRSISALIPGSFVSGNDFQLESAASIELCPVLIAAMDRIDTIHNRGNLPRLRVKDGAAMAFALMKGHAKEIAPGFIDGRFLEIDPAVFDQKEPDAAKRDQQISALQRWYADNKNNLVWNQETKRLEIK